MIWSQKYHIIVFLIAASIISCRRDNTSEIERSPDDKILVKMEDKSLYLSDIKALIPANSSPTDSSQIIRSFSENWAKEIVLLLGAEKSLPKDFNLERLVKNYRESLLINNFEKTYLENNLDTVITAAQLENFYEEHKDNFVSNEKILKFWFAKIPANTKGLDKFFERWKKNDHDYIQSFCDKHADVFDLNDSVWNRESQTKLYFPEKLVKKLKFDGKKDFQSNHDDYEYFFTIKNVIKEGSNEPIEFVQDKVVKLILHQRKSEMLNNLRNELYKEAIENNQIVFYNNN